MFGNYAAQAGVIAGKNLTTITFWDFIANPSNKTLSNFNIIYTSGNIISDWGDSNKSSILSNINYNHTFQ